MEKKINTLCLEVLNRLNEAGVLKDLIVIGSWSIYFYKYYFKSKAYSTYIRTKDIDFLVPIPLKFQKETNIFELVKDLGFLERYRGSKGYIQLEHPDLSIEFLVPERGRGEDKPYSISQLSINAQPLRFLDFLIENTISVNAEGLHIKLPHPAAYALHKFIIFKRRSKVEKRDRDIEGALRVFNELVRHKKHIEIRYIFKRMHKKWQQKILDNLKSIEEPEIVSILTE
ncbi:MAG: nucleotidyltransferase domain-containing protein [Candidatus Omnitrophica bacterium]|nr:nucleotidyltransferase domain-containing protein [Candidatus Omnitrophota bacterium]